MFYLVSAEPLPDECRALFIEQEIEKKVVARLRLSVTNEPSSLFKLVVQAADLSWVNAFKKDSKFAHQVLENKEVMDLQGLGNIATIIVLKEHYDECMSKFCEVFKPFQRLRFTIDQQLGWSKFGWNKAVTFILGEHKSYQSFGVKFSDLNKALKDVEFARQNKVFDKPAVLFAHGLDRKPLHELNTNDAAGSQFNPPERKRLKRA